MELGYRLTQVYSCSVYASIIGSVNKTKIPCTRWGIYNIVSVELVSPFLHSMDGT